LSLPVRVGEEAEAELVDAASWYESHREGLGAAFLGAVEATVARIAEAPRVGSMVPSLADPDVRRRPVQRFPYHIVYMELPDHLRVLAIAHDRRRPGYWMGRPGI
jgi:plasmid stabilization system protein ParE